MRKALLLLSLVLFFLSAQGQKLTAEKLLDKLSCSDTTCFLQFFNTMGYSLTGRPEAISKSFTRYHLQAKADCPIVADSAATEGVELIAVDKSILKIELVTCYDRYKILLSALVKEGFSKVDEDSKEITLHSKRYPNWEMVLLNEYTMHHFGIYSIRFDKISSVIKN